MRIGDKGGKATVESPGWAKTSDRYGVEIVCGSKSVEITGRPA